MTLYLYVKKESHKKNLIPYISTLLVLTGVSILSWVLFPIISFELNYGQKFGELIQPVPNKIIKTVLIDDLPQVLKTSNADYTKVNTWFPKAVDIKVANSNNSYYYLSIPKLGINRANVLIGGDDLSKNLIHFTGAVPGSKEGGPVIFGHSTIPWLYNPLDYKTIFTKLPQLDKGDEILVDFDNISFTYKITDMKIVFPEDLSVLDQDNSHQTITLITCVPPGTFLKRLIIKGILVSI